MGSTICLAVGKLEVDWGKNSTFSDHSPLFQATDVAQVPYYYVKEDGEEYQDEFGDYHFELVKEYKDGLSKPLWQAIERINLLGHTATYSAAEFEFLSFLHQFDKEKFRFEHLAKALKTVDLNKMSAEHESSVDFGRFFRRYLYNNLGLPSIVPDDDYARYNIGEGMENLSAYTVLQLVAPNPTAKDLSVTWQFADIESGGWAHRGHFVRPLEPSQRFLIVTEGRSDATIIGHAIHLLKPHLRDFFHFVDMGEGYPFAGTGNLFNFTKGLIGIGVQNNIIILYDNDAEGIFNFARTERLMTPRNMRVLKLPNLADFDSFQTIGPAGRHLANINEQAAAIECYLDVGTSPLVRWTHFNRERGVYQGELVDKAAHAARFLELTTIMGTDYDFSKIAKVVDMLVNECIAMREESMLSELHAEMRSLGSP